MKSTMKNIKFIKKTEKTGKKRKKIVINKKIMN